VKPLVQRFLGTREQRITSVEWWAHRRDVDSGSGHQLHYDLDEAGLAGLPPGVPPAHPLASSVLYLSGPPAGQDADATEMAYTLVTDQTLERGSEAKRAWLCPPALNRLLLFDGSLLHGVVPRLPSQAADRKSQAEPRLTLMLGFWGDAPSPRHSPAPKCIAELGPNMEGPCSNSGWPSLFKTTIMNDSGATAQSAAPPRSALLGPISPVWIQVPKADDEQLEVDGEVDFVGRWFLQHEPCRLQEIAIAEARACALPSAKDDVEEVSMEELLQLRALAQGGNVRETSVDLLQARAKPDIEEVSLDDLARLRDASSCGTVCENALAKVNGGSGVSTHGRRAKKHRVAKR